MAARLAYSPRSGRALSSGTVERGGVEHRAQTRLDRRDPCRGLEPQQGPRPAAQSVRHSRRDQGDVAHQQPTTHRLDDHRWLTESSNDQLSEGKPQPAQHQYGSPDWLRHDDPIPHDPLDGCAESHRPYWRATRQSTCPRLHNNHPGENADRPVPQVLLPVRASNCWATNWVRRRFSLPWPVRQPPGQAGAPGAARLAAAARGW